jgi:HK97 family phage major capsid protein
MELQEIKDAVDGQLTAFEQFKTANDTRLGEIEVQGKASHESLAKIDSILVSIEEFKTTISDLQAKQQMPLRDSIENLKSDEQRAHMKAFDHYMRNPKSPSAIADLEEKATAYALTDERQKSFLERNGLKAVTISGTGGGNAIPTEIHSRILDKVSELSPMRSIANVTSVSNENTKFVVGDDNDTSGWAGAGDTRSASTTPLVQATALTYGTCYGYPSIQEEALDDIEFDVMAWLIRAVSRRLAVAEGTAFVTGNGIDKPTGFIGTPVSTNDSVSPQRAFGVLQYFPTGVAATFPLDRLGSPAGDPAGPLFDLVYGLKATYRANSNWVMNRTTLSTLMQFRDADGNYIFRPAALAGVPATLMGYPIIEMEDMADIGANAVPVAFGDFDEGYQIGDIVNTMRITVDDNITTPGFTKFYARRRVGGKTLNDDAIKVIKVAAS